MIHHHRKVIFPVNGLNWYDAVHRMYDPQLGKFGQLDKLGDLNYDMSLYVFGKDNPISLNDPAGLDPVNPGKREKEVRTEGTGKGNVQEVLETFVFTAPRYQSLRLYAGSVTIDTHFKGNLAKFKERISTGQDIWQENDRGSYSEDLLNNKLLDQYLRDEEAKQFEQDFYMIYFSALTLPEDIVGLVGLTGKAVRILPKLASKTGRVFFNGGEMAKNAATGFARANGKITLNMTVKGRILEVMDKFVAEKYMQRLWDKTSASFAKGARGSIDMFQNAVEGASLGRNTWRTQEYVNLQKEVNIIFHDVFK